MYIYTQYVCIYIYILYICIYLSYMFLLVGIEIDLHLFETVYGVFHRGMELTPCVASKAYPYATCEARRELCLHIAQGAWRCWLGSDRLERRVTGLVLGEKNGPP